MSQWSSVKARRVLAALLRIGWSIKRESGSHKILYRSGWPDVVFAFHDKDEIGQRCWLAWPSTRDWNPKTFN
jgi:predicted RNA binding protein YcfA (HicA-like mRNA interferase family)